MVQSAGFLAAPGLGNVLAPAGVVESGLDAVSGAGGLERLFRGLLAEGVGKPTAGLGGEAFDLLSDLPLETLPLGQQSLEFFQVERLQISTQLTQTLQLGQGPALPVQGEAVVVEHFIGRVQELYAKLVVEGGLTMEGAGDAEQLAAALTKLGMTPEDANALAGRITTMLEILDQQQDLSDEEVGTLTMMMLAAGQQGADGGRVVLQIVSVEREVLTQQSVALDLLQSGQANHRIALSRLSVARLTWDVSRDILGIEAGGEKKNVAAQVVVPSGLIEGVVADEGRKYRELLLSVEPIDGQASVVLSLPEIANVVPKPVVLGNSIEQQVSLSEVATQVPVAGLLVKDMAEAPKGEVIYKYLEDKKGVEVLKVIQPLEDTGAGRLLLEHGTRQDFGAVGVREQSQGASFAERLQQAQQANVGQQVAVQIKPLVEQGGGMIRVVLNPVELGEIRIELSVVDGKVQGSMSATHPATLEQLARDLHSLRHGLAEAGLKLGEQGISLMLNNQNGEQQQFSQQQMPEEQSRGRVNKGGEVSEEIEVMNTLSSRWISPERVLDVEV